MNNSSLTLKTVVERAVKLGKEGGYCLHVNDLVPLLFPTISHVEVQESITLLHQRKDVSVEQWDDDCYFIGPVKKSKQK